MKLIDPKAHEINPRNAFSRKERWTLTSMYIWILLQNVLLIAFLKFIEHKDKAWFDVFSSFLAAFVYRISLLFAGIPL
jgi:hypothetical protein